MEDLLWWENLKEGEKYLFSFLFIDRVVSTKDQDYYTPQVVEQRTQTFHKIVEDQILNNNGKLLEWHGDGNTAFFYASNPASILDRANLLSRKAVETAFSIFLEMVLHEELKAYISINIGMLLFNKELGKIKSHDLDVGGHILGACPEAGILIHKDVFNSLDDLMKDKFKYFGTTSKYLAPVFIYPKQREIPDKKQDNFINFENDKYLKQAAFLKFVKERYGKLVPKGLKQEQLTSIDIFKIFCQLKVKIKDKNEFIDYKLIENDKINALTHEFKKLSFLNTEKISNKISVTDILKQNRHCVILGSPGAGKSTFIKWLAVTYAYGKMSVLQRLSIEESLFPFPVSVGHLSKIWVDNNKGIGVKDAIVRYFKIHDNDVSLFIDDEIKNGRAFILFDGMDEIQADLDRREVASWIESFMQNHPDNRYIITSRIIGYPGINMVNGETYIIEDLTLEEAKPLIEKWTNAIEIVRIGDNETAEKAAKDEAEKLINTLKNTLQFAGFISNPFLITLTVLIHELEARLPNHRIQLFERMIQTLVETWHQARGIGIIQPEEQKIDFKTEAIPILAPLALWMHETYSAGAIPENDLRDFINKKLKERGISVIEINRSVDNFLTRLKTGSGLIEEKGRDIWGFSHLSFQEYLSAVELVRDDLYMNYLKKYAYNPRWEEVLILVSSELGIIQTSTKKVTVYIETILNGTGEKNQEHILKRHILLAGKCIANSANVDMKLVNKVAAELLDLVFDDTSGLRERAVLVLKEMIYLKPVMDIVKEKFTEVMKNGESGNKEKMINSIEYLKLEENWAKEIVKFGLNNDDALVRIAALRASIRIVAYREDLIEIINNKLKDKDKVVRSKAFLLSSIIKKDGVIEELKKAIKDNDDFVRYNAILAILVMPEFNLQKDWILEALKKGIEDQNYSIRYASIYAIEEMNIKDDWVIDAIKDILSDKDNLLIVFAIDAIGELELKETWAIEAIKDGTKNSFISIRESAINAINKLNLKEDWAIEAVKSALNDDDSNIQISAIYAIKALDINEDRIIKKIAEIYNKSNNEKLKSSAYEALWNLM
ncbi:MAG: NACHT domain-containing protein [Candidatus Firestonebacteria bacterium]|nr:NACHT domain-containing protein [Candidatus Firestonebacteria bacterium]